MSLAGDSGNCMTVVDQVSWRQSMQAFVYCHGELVLNPLANWQPVKVAEHRSDVVEHSNFRAPVTTRAAAFWLTEWVISFFTAHRHITLLVLQWWCVISATANITRNNNIMSFTFPLQKVLVYLQPLLRNPNRKLQNSMKLRCGYGYYAVQGHPRSPSLVPIESSYAY